MAKIFKSIEPGGRADYGLYGSKAMAGMAAGVFSNLALAIFLPLKGRWKWLRLAFVIGSLNNLFNILRLLYYSKLGRFKQRERLLDLTEMRPDARVLDIGSRNGLLAIGAAKRSPGLKVTAVDDWKYGGSEETLRSNTDLEEVGGRVHVYDADPHQLSFPDSSFEVILSDFYLHKIGRKERGIGQEKSLKGKARQTWRRQERAKALSELDRVLAPGGVMVLSDIAHTTEYAEFLKEQNYSVHTYGPYRDIALPLKVVVAKKPM
ncbi:MAG TPA: methyltransferase domain-containing protein [Chloroflexia bacterium]|nr:methyltransferase domain-containing protein [Chloroflexia bacterium]